MSSNGAPPSDTSTAVGAVSSDAILTDCDDLTQVFSNLSVSDLNSDLRTLSSSGSANSDAGPHTEATALDSEDELLGELLDQLTEDVGKSVPVKWKRPSHPEEVGGGTSATTSTSSGRVHFASERRVLLIRRRDRPADFSKVGHRQVPNPWRRFGALRQLHQVGGWCTRNKRDKHVYYVKPNSAPPKAPNHAHLSLHHDGPLLDQRLFRWQIQRHASGQQCGETVGRQIADKCRWLAEESQTVGFGRFPNGKSEQNGGGVEPMSGSLRSGAGSSSGSTSSSTSTSSSSAQSCRRPKKGNMAVKKQRQR